MIITVSANAIVIVGYEMRPTLGPNRIVCENPHIQYQRIGDCITTLLYTITVYQTHRDPIFTDRVRGWVGVWVGWGFGKKLLVFVSKKISVSVFFLPYIYAYMYASFGPLYASKKSWPTQKKFQFTRSISSVIVPCSTSVSAPHSTCV